MLVTDTYKQLTRYINHINIKRKYKGKIYICMYNKRVKGWQNIDKLCAEYKEVIQKSRIECLRGIIYIECKRK